MPNSRDDTHAFSPSGSLYYPVDYGRPLITSGIVANFFTGLVVSTALTALAILADIAGYIVYSVAKESRVTAHNVKYFVPISEVGSFIFGLMAFMLLMSTSLVKKAVIDDDFCAQMSLRFLLLFNFVVNMALGFLEDHLMNHDRHADLIWPCIWSKLTGLGLVASIGVVFYASGIDQPLLSKLCQAYQIFFESIDSRIGDTSPFYADGGYLGRARMCLFGRKDHRDFASLNPMVHSPDDRSSSGSGSAGGYSPIRSS